MANIWLGLTIGIISFILLYIGKGIQKYAIEGYKQEKLKIKSKNTGMWIFGTILTSINMFVHWAALFFAPINLIAPLEGIGLITLIIFSFYVLKERITPYQLIGIALIILGTFFVTFCNTNTGDVNFVDFNLTVFLYFIVIVLVIETLAFVISRLKNNKGAGVILGLTAGSFMSFQTITKRITAIPDPTLTIIFIFITFLTSTLTLVFTQLAFSKGNANVVIPCFTSASIILAVLAGYLSLSENLVLPQIIGIFIVVLGVILLTAFRINLN